MPTIPGRADRARARLPGAPARPDRRRSKVTIEQIVAVDAPRDFRLHPRERLVAYTSEAAGARQLFVLGYRAGVASYPTQLTASEKAVTDPQWSPDGRRLAFVR